MKIQKNKFFTLLILALTFAAPGLLAYLFFQHPNWLGSEKTNKGTLISPPIAMGLWEGKPKWRLIYWQAKGCDKACLNQLNVLGRVRLALGRKLYQVDEWLIFSEQNKSEADELRPIFKGQDIHVASINASESKKFAKIASNEGIFVVDPENYLILSYKSGVNPDDIYKDLKLLLNNSGMNGD